MCQILTEMAPRSNENKRSQNALGNRNLEDRAALVVVQNLADPP